MNFGNIFQEYSQSNQTNRRMTSAKLQFLWIVATTFITMAFVGNLKSILVKKTYEPKTSSLREIIASDKRVFVYEGNGLFMESFNQEDIARDIWNQALKTNGTYPMTGYVITVIKPQQ